MKYTLEHTVVSILFGLATLAFTGCASEPERPERELQKADTESERRTVERPSDEELADSPCGNPDWAQLPDGAEETPASPAEESETNGQSEPGGETEPSDAPDGAEGDGGEQSEVHEPTNTELATQKQPCGE